MYTLIINKNMLKGSVPFEPKTTAFVAVKFLWQTAINVEKNYFL